MPLREAGAMMAGVPNTTVVEYIELILLEIGRHETAGDGLSLYTTHLATLRH